MSRRKRRKYPLLYMAGSLIALAISYLALNFAGMWHDLPGLRQLADPMAATAATLEGLELHAIDIGQGGCLLARLGDAAALLDAGDVGHGEEIYRYLAAQQVKRLDYMIISHPHADHIGSMQYILERMEVGRVVMANLPEEQLATTKLFDRLLAAIEERGIEVVFAQPGDVLPLGEASFTVLGPLANSYTILNNYSLVLRLEYGQRAFLLPGDAEGPAEKDLLASGQNLQADVLWAGHHGSKTSSTKGFLLAVSPVAAFIQCGVNNDYGHPNRELLQRLEETQALCLRTDLDGHILFSTDGQRLAVTTQKGGSYLWEDFA